MSSTIQQADDGQQQASPFICAWTVYMPGMPDYPDSYQAREVELRGPKHGGLVLTGSYIASQELGVIRERLSARGLWCIGRRPTDAESIVEVWI